MELEGDNVQPAPVVLYVGEHDPQISPIVGKQDHQQVGALLIVEARIRDKERTPKARHTVPTRATFLPLWSVVSGQLS